MPWFSAGGIGLSEPVVEQEKQEIEKLAEGVCAAIWLFGIPLWLAMEGFVLVYLVRWFLVPLGFPELSLWQAAGISLIVGFMAHQPQAHSIKASHRLFHTITKPTLTLLFGWFVHLMVSL